MDFTSSPAIQELPVQSAICDPEDGDVVKLTDDGRLPLRGTDYPRSKRLIDLQLG